MFIHLSNFSARQKKFHPGNPLEIDIEDKRSYARLFLLNFSHQNNTE